MVPTPDLRNLQEGQACSSLSITALVPPGRDANRELQSSPCRREAVSPPSKFNFNSVPQLVNLSPEMISPAILCDKWVMDPLGSHCILAFLLPPVARPGYLLPLPGTGSFLLPPQDTGVSASSLRNRCRGFLTQRASWTLGKVLVLPAPPIRYLRAPAVFRAQNLRFHHDIYRVAKPAYRKASRAWRAVMRLASLQQLANTVAH